MGEWLIDAAPPRMDLLAHGVLEASSDRIEVLGLDGTIRFLNRVGAQLLELDGPEDLYGTCWTDHWSDVSRADAERALQTAEQGGHGRFIGTVQSSLGRAIWWDVTVSPVRDENGRTCQLVAVSRDITRFRQAFEEVDVARKKLNSVLSSTTDSIIAVDLDWTIKYVNERASALVGCNGALAVGRNLWDVYPEEAGSDFYRNYCRAIETQKPVQFEGYVTRLEMWLDVHAFPTEDGVSIFFRDVTEAKRTRDEINYLAHHDALTGLPNRAVFMKQFQAAQEAAGTARTALAVFYIDLDDFKMVNDTLGHDAGDALLIETARRLRGVLNGRGLVARIGGDEFAILLTEDADQQTAERHASEIKATLSRPVVYADSDLSCKASMGIALYPVNEPNPAELIKCADLALYKAKRSGGDGFAFFSPEIREAVQKRLSALSCARDALNRDAIVPYYQPKIALETGRVCGFEALLRWTSPSFGVNSPGLIKEAFEDFKLSLELGRRMRQRVLSDMVAWKQAGLDFGHVAFNVSAPEFFDTSLADDILAELHQAGLAASMLEIEVTETVFLDGSADVVRTLDKLHTEGVSIALDDFGTGYASLLHLSSFPVSWLKIDQSFVREMCDQPDKRAIVKAIIGLARSLGMQVVAEGVETRQQWRELKKRGCDLAQGYLIAKPMSASRVPHFLETWSSLNIYGARPDLRAS